MTFIDLPALSIPVSIIVSVLSPVRAASVAACAAMPLASMVEKASAKRIVLVMMSSGFGNASGIGWARASVADTGRRGGWMQPQKYSSAPASIGLPMA
ncbi:hypothetical protein [Bosea sp. (in: a-proteobacteria)]|uniref:hypothetical protein n=1 Tax=Bosea sp. (in: a-proteobacteria) TaxID=1871050 RepID=UPI0025BBCE2F|nr:hypothetical protein [Bosea sp. (in: a-proteobacteria)]